VSSDAFRFFRKLVLKLSFNDVCRYFGDLTGETVKNFRRRFRSWCDGLYTCRGAKKVRWRA